MPVRVILADDHQVVLDGLKQLLESDPDMQVVGMVTTGWQAVQMAGELKPDVMVLDVAMPELNGIGAMKQIRDVSPQTRVVGLSMHTSARIIIDMLHAGACGYVTKSAPVEEVVQAVKAAMEGRRFISPMLQPSLPAELVNELAAQSKVLSDRESQVLQLVAEGKSSKEIAALLQVTVKTIEWHRKSIMDKLAVRSIAELTKYAIREGITQLEK